MIFSNAFERMPLRGFARLRDLAHSVRSSHSRVALDSRPRWACRSQVERARLFALRRTKAVK
jgi:hypothetical protein